MACLRIKGARIREFQPRIRLAFQPKYKVVTALDISNLSRSENESVHHSVLVSSFVNTFTSTKKEDFLFLSFKCTILNSSIRPAVVINIHTNRTWLWPKVCAIVCHVIKTTIHVYTGVIRCTCSFHTCWNWDVSFWLNYWDTHHTI